MSILSVDNISPIGSGTSVTVNSAATLVVTNANSTGVVTATTFSGSGASLTNLPAANLTGTLPAISGANLTGLLKNVVEDTSPQLGGDLASNSNDILMAANDRVVFGSDALRVKHTGSHADIENTTGNITIKNDSSSSTEQILIQAKGGENSIKAIANGAVELYHDNSKKIETTSTGITISGNANFANNNKAIFGTGNDAAIYHNDTDFVINAQDSGATRNMYLYAGTVNEGGIYLFSSGGDTMFKALTDANCFLYYDNSLKLRTMTNGIENRGHNFAVTNNTYDLGTTGLKWRKVYASNTPIVLASINLASNNQHSTFGVQTVYHYGSGTFQVVFSANMPNANYVVTASAVGSVNGDSMVVAGIADHTNYRTVGSIRARVSYSPNNSDGEVTNVNLAFFANN